LILRLIVADIHDEFSRGANACNGWKADRPGQCTSRDRPRPFSMAEKEDPNANKNTNNASGHSNIVN
jgi:hypothetical protein